MIASNNDKLANNNRNKWPGFMDSPYDIFRAQARRIAARLPIPDFYNIHADERRYSEKVYQTTPVMRQLQQEVSKIIDNNYGHGMFHAEQVTVDAGALMVVEGRRDGYTSTYLEQRIICAQCAGVLHDIRRSQMKHAEKGAEFAKHFLSQYPFNQSEINDISTAIRNHEAFSEQSPMESRAGRLLSDCLYDADKFRWGPDNFTHMLWDMLVGKNTPPKKFMHHYPSGMDFLARIKKTFRTRTGKNYGPQFIDFGLTIGEELYNFICFWFKGLDA